LRKVHATLQHTATQTECILLFTDNPTQSDENTTILRDDDL